MGSASWSPSSSRTRPRPLSPSSSTGRRDCLPTRSRALPARHPIALTVAVKQVTVATAVRATLMDTMGNVYNDLGLYDQAEGLMRESLQIRKQVLGSENPDVATSLYAVAKVLYRKNDYDGAEARYREALAMRRKLLGNEHPNVAESLNWLALVVSEKGDYDGAEALLREALAKRRKLFGNEHPDVAITMNGLASMLDGKGDYAAAEDLLSDALGTLRKLLGNTHPDVAYTLNILGEVSSHAGEFAQAEEAFKESLQIARRIFPPRPYLHLRGPRWIGGRPGGSGARAAGRDNAPRGNRNRKKDASEGRLRPRPGRESAGGLSDSAAQIRRSRVTSAG